MNVAARRARADGVRGRRAGLLSRLMADGMDLVMTGVILFAVLVAFAVVRYMLGSAPLRLPEVSATFTGVAYVVTEISYLAIAWSATGRSVGKRIVGLRAVTADGTQLGKWRATGRAVLCTFFGGPSLLWVLFSSRNAAVHDLVMQTAVVHDWSDEFRTTTSPTSSATAVEPATPVGAVTPESIPL